MEKPLKIRLHVLSPIHIGCDDVYEPTSFVIDDKKKKLIEFDPMDLVKALNDKQRDEFLKACSGDNLLTIMKFIKNNCMNIRGKEVDIALELITHYKKVLDMSSFDKNAVINQFTMNKTAYNPQTIQPYIPGTSLKGSMRTAYLSALAGFKQIKQWDKKADDLETKLLNRNENPKEKINSDPFRMVKVSDLLPLENCKTKIVYATNKKKKKSDKASKAADGPPQIFEAIMDGCFEGSLTIEIPQNGSGIHTKITIVDLKSAINSFFVNIMKIETAVLKEIGIATLTINPKYKEAFGETFFLIRLGRHSGAEAVTIEGNRQIKIIKRPEPLDHATTLWLASDSPRPQNNNDLQPFGWAVLEIVPFDVKEGIYSAKKQPDLKPDQDAGMSTSEPVLPKKQVTIVSAETILWENAILTWSPGNQTLKAAKGNNKTELKLGSDRSIVPEKYHEVLFNKRKEVTANISVEKTGNALKIVGIS